MVYHYSTIKMMHGPINIRFNYLLAQNIHLQELANYCGFVSGVVLLWFDVCWCYGVVWLGWCGILMQAEAVVLHPA